VGQGPSVDSVGLHSGCGDGPDPQGMREQHFVYHGLQHVEDQVPVAARLQHGFLLPLQGKGGVAGEFVRRAATLGENHAAVVHDAVVGELPMMSSP